MKTISFLWPADLLGRVVAIVFLCLPLAYAVLSALAWRQSMPFSVPALVVGAWLVVLGALLAIPSTRRSSPPRLVNVGMILFGAGVIAIAIASTRADLLSLALLDVGGLVVALAGLLMAGSTALGALAARRP